MPEVCEFAMDPGLLHAMVQRQAGSLVKAICELVMNSVDAGATRVDITLTENSVRVVDDGKGIQSREEVAENFAKFGRPQTAEELARKTYGQFRIGRCQAFAYGRNVWRTGPFELRVDMKTRGLAFELDDAEPQDGCDIVIELYEPVQWGVTSAMRDLSRAVAWVAIPVWLNGALISTNPHTSEWDITTDDAYMSLRPSADELVVYNQGIRVCSMGTAAFGVGGIVCSRSRLSVNFARNELMDDCPVWRRIHAVLTAHAATFVCRKSRLTVAERKAALSRAGAGKLADWAGLKLFELGDSSMVSLEQLVRLLVATPRLTIADAGDTQADYLHLRKLAVCVTKETAETFGAYYPSSLRQKLQSSATACGLPASHLDDVRAADISTFANEFKAERTLLDVDQLSETELLWLRILTSAKRKLASVEGIARNLHVGAAADANAWTDGQTMIVFDRGLLQDNRFTLESSTRIATVWCHELCHLSDSSTHCHDGPFYRLYHDSSRVTLPLMIAAINQAVCDSLTAVAKRLPKPQRLAAALTANNVPAEEVTPC